MWRPTCPSAPALLSRRLQRLTCPRQRPFGPGRRARYPASYTRTSGGDAGPTVLAFLLPFGHRRSLLGHPVPAPEFSPLTVGLPRSSAWTRTGFPCSARMRHGWDRAPSLPRGRRCSHGQSGILDRRLPPLNGRSLSPRSLSPSRDVGITGHQQGFKIVRPPSLPFACDPRTERGPSGFSLSSTPDWAGPSHACQGRDRPRTLTRITSSTSSNLLQRNHSPRATSCRNPVRHQPTP